MRSRMRPSRLTAALVGAALLTALAGCGPKADAQEPQPPQPPAPAAPDTEPSETDLVWQEVRRLYQKAKEAGEQVPGDVAEWARDEMGKAGTFEYEVVEVRPLVTAQLQMRLDTLGRQRWECFDVEEGEEMARLYCRRPVKSYLGALAIRDLLRLVPLLPLGGGSGD